MAEDRGWWVSETAKTAVGEATPVLFGRLSRRIQALMLDMMLFTAGMLACLSVMSASGSDMISTVVGTTAASCALLYEPVLVSYMGGTIGHRLRNLRVVDERTGANLGFFKATSRFVIKTVLGIPSFITMMATRRHQAVHDLATRSTVRINDVASAEPGHYHHELIDLVAAGMPSILRRLLVITIYSSISFLLIGIVFALFDAFEVLSSGCLYDDRKCSSGDRSITIGSTLLWIMALFVIVFKGWRGQLWGARRSV